MTRFGSVAPGADPCRDSRGTAPIETLARDIVHAFRTFRQSRASPARGG